MNKIAVLIPCYNEELTIKKVITDFKKELPDADIYVCDNNSKDKTAEIAKKAGAIVMKENRQGKGHAVRRLFKEVEADIYVMVDGDDTYPAEFIHELLKPIVNDEADMCIGDRLTQGNYKKEVKKHFHSFGNSLVKKTINLLFGTKLKDIMTGYRVFTREFVKNFPVMSPGFELETEMTLFALDKRFRIKEIPIVFRERPDGSESKINTVKDGFKVVRTIIRMFKNYRPLKFFGILATVFLLLGLIIGIPVIVEFAQTKYITKVPSAILATGLMIFALISYQSGIILQTIVRQNKEQYEMNLMGYNQNKKR